MMKKAKACAVWEHAYGEIRYFRFEEDAEFFLKNNPTWIRYKKGDIK